MDEYTYPALCIVCGDFIEYCIGHGEHGDSIWENHDNGDHSNCHPAITCED